MGVICLLHRYSKISAVRIPPKGLRITLEIREFGYLIIFQLGIPLGGAFKRSYREASARSFDPLNSYTVIIHPKKTLCKDKNSPTAVAVGESMLGQIYRFTLMSWNLYTLRLVEKEYRYSFASSTVTVNVPNFR